jgi:hypothetical protein
LIFYRKDPRKKQRLAIGSLIDLNRELRRGDVVLMVLLAREEKGWNFGSSRNRTATGSEIAGAALEAACAREEEEEQVRKGQ